MKRRKVNLPLIEVIAVSLILHLVGLFILGGLVIWQNLSNPDPEFEAPPPAEPINIEPVRVSLKQMQKMSQAPVKPIQVHNLTKINVPVVDIALPSVENRVSYKGFSKKGLGLGSFDTSKLAVDFFGLSGSAERIAFVVDYSSSMSKNAGNIRREELMRKEFIRSINSLPEQAMVSVLFFAGPVWEPQGLEAKELRDEIQKANAIYKIPDQKGADSFRIPEGMDPPTPKWRNLSDSNKRELTQQIQNCPLTFGTIWSLPFEVIFTMEPAPDLIFFLTDGAVSLEDREKTITMVKEWHRKNPDAKINTIALGIPGAEEALKTIADITDGSYTLITKELKHN